MSETLTVQTLIEDFSSRLQNIDRLNTEDVVGKEPLSPQIVLYLGADSMKGHAEVSRHLSEMWPQYQDELSYVGLNVVNGTYRYYAMQNHDAAPVEIDEEQLCAMISAMFGTMRHFRDRSKLMVYYILDSTSIRSKDDLHFWFSVIENTRKRIGLDATSLMDLLFLLLNEDLSHRRFAAAIKNELVKVYGCGKNCRAVSNIMLLSNWRSDHAFLENWDICYKIAASVIAICNNTDVSVTSSVFCQGVLTVGYACEQKPIPLIAQVVVRKLLMELAEKISFSGSRLPAETELRQKLGLSSEGNFELLDEYAESVLFRLLPTEGQLSCFPRKNNDDSVDVSNMTAGEFDEHTMGSWRLFLSQLVEEARKKIEIDPNLRSKWDREYRKLLTSAFRNEELIALSDHIDEVEQIMKGKKATTMDNQVLFAAKMQLKEMLSSDPALISIFRKAVLEQGRIAAEFRQSWNNLLNSRRQIFAVRDKNMLTFYERKVQSFWDRNETKIRESVDSMHDTKQLKDFLVTTLSNLIKSDDIFYAPFEEELEARLNVDSLPQDAKQYIRKKLTGSQVYIYYQANFDLGQPIVSAILMKSGTPLYSNLRSNLPDSTYYYNTGNGNAAEALVVYQITADNLATGEGE